MTITRAPGLMLVIGGIVAGTWFGRVPMREIPRANGYFVLAGDLHVHAAWGDGAIAPWELIREARRRDLDVITVTNHNQRVAAGFAARLAPHGASDPLVIIGQEVTTPRFHMIAAGISSTIDWRLSGSDAIRAIHEQGGVAIAAHPTLKSWRADEGAMTVLDGAEAFHPLSMLSSTDGQQLIEFYNRASERNRSLAPIGSSDFHVAGTLGECRTFLFARDVSREGVLDAIREGRTVAYAPDGRLFGDPSLVSVVRGLIAARPPVFRADLNSQIAAWVTLLGLVLLLGWG